MSTGRNVHEKNAQGILKRLLDPPATESHVTRRALVSRFCDCIVDAAVTEMRKELKSGTLQMGSVVDSEEGGGKSPGEIVAEQLEKEGRNIPHPPTYEQRG